MKSLSSSDEILGAMTYDLNNRGFKRRFNRLELLAPRVNTDFFNESFHTVNKTRKRYPLSLARI